MKVLLYIFHVDQTNTFRSSFVNWKSPFSGGWRTLLPHARSDTHHRPDGCREKFAQPRPLRRRESCLRVRGKLSHDGLATQVLSPHNLCQEMLQHVRALILDDICSDCNGFDANLVVTAFDAEIPVLSPLLSPRVLDCPIFLTEFLAPANQQHCMINLLPLQSRGMKRGRITKLILGEYTTRIKHKVAGRLKADHEGAVPVELEHHIRCTGVAVPPTHVAVVGSAIPLSDLGNVATDLALTLRVVGRARRWNQANVLRPLGTKETITPLAALIVLRTV
mmetsp:Transcript_12909/g.35669  ORF Transcript_12909/g.35669 Transcript_12909/m.35669 type:complete len:278 (-) Transcript_12909:6-839(-)